ncbi:protein of unknown function [Methylacidimicrobium sp. AP8]|nr:protein of unknown function [Methylacidimicrobium sp. AP8]
MATASGKLSPSSHFSQAFSYGLQNGLVCFAPAWFSILAVCLHTAPVENLRPPRTQAHLRRLGYEICEKWPLGGSTGSTGEHHC